MYVHNILQRSPDELVREIIEAQKGDPSQGDFCKLIDKRTRMKEDKIYQICQNIEIPTMTLVTMYRPPLVTILSLSANRPTSKCVPPSYKLF